MKMTNLEGQAIEHVLERGEPTGWPCVINVRGDEEEMHTVRYTIRTNVLMAAVFCLRD